MKVKDRISVYRLIPLLLIFLTTLGVSCILCMMNNFYADEIYCVVFVDLLFFFLLVFQLEYERKRVLIGQNSETTFVRVAVGYLLCSGIMVGFVFLPEFLKPVIFFPLILCALGNESLAITMGSFLCVLYAIVTGCNANELVVYMLMVILGAPLGRALAQKKYRIYIGFLYLAMSLLLPCVFYYWTYKEINSMIYGYGLLNGILGFLFAVFLFGRIHRETQQEVDNTLYDMVQEDYPLVLEAKAYSIVEYQHARKVSDLCYQCALLTGYDPNLCAAAGFYYRMGRWIGEPFVENGVKRAQSRCFPIAVVEILNEYYGENEKPSTPESALVHMVDALIIKLELLSKDVGSSQWNRDILIYQTLNDFSSSGLYDASGMSMNQFLKIREFLAKKEDLF